MKTPPLTFTQDNLYQAFDKASIAAKEKENVCNLLQVIGARLRDLRLSNFDGRLITNHD